MNPAQDLSGARISEGGSRAAAEALPRQAQMPMVADLAAILAEKFTGRDVIVATQPSGSQYLVKINGIASLGSQLFLDCSDQLIPLNVVRFIKLK